MNKQVIIQGERAIICLSSGETLVYVVGAKRGKLGKALGTRLEIEMRREGQRRASCVSHANLPSVHKDPFIWAKVR